MTKGGRCLSDNNRKSQELPPMMIHQEDGNDYYLSLTRLAWS
jgi:hypothetical protein